MHEEKNKQYIKQMQYFSQQRAQILASDGHNAVNKKMRMRKINKKNGNIKQAIKIPKTLAWARNTAIDNSG